MFYLLSNTGDTEIPGMYGQGRYRKQYFHQSCLRGWKKTYSKRLNKLFLKPLFVIYINDTCPESRERIHPNKVYLVQRFISQTFPRSSPCPKHCARYGIWQCLPRQPLAGTNTHFKATGLKQFLKKFFFSFSFYPMMISLIPYGFAT